MDSSPRERFVHYEESFARQAGLVSSETGKLREEGLNFEDIIRIIVTVENDLSDVEGWLRAMEVELKTVGSSDKKLFSEKVARAKREFADLSRSLQSRRMQAESAALQRPSDTRKTLTTTNNRLDNATNMLQNSQKLVHQSEVAGEHTLSTLDLQRKTIVHAQEFAQGTKQRTRETRSVLNEMARKILFLCFNPLSARILILSGN